MAAGDLALQITITASSDATPIIEQVSAAVDALQATLDAVGTGASGIEALDAAFATLDTEVSALSGSLGQFPAGVEAATAAFDTFDTALTTTMQELGLIPAEGDAAAQGLSSAGIGAEQASTAIDALDTALVTLYQGLGLIAPEADVGAQGLTALGNAAQQSGAEISADGVYMDAFARTFNGIEAGAVQVSDALGQVVTANGEAAISFTDLGSAMSFIDSEASVASAAFSQLAASDGELALSFGNTATAMTFVDDQLAMATVGAETAGASYYQASGAALALGNVMNTLGFSAETTSNAMMGLDGVLSTVGGAFSAVGAEAGSAAVGLQEESVAADESAVATRAAGEAGSMAGFQLMMLAGMLLMAGSGFVSMGTDAQTQLAIVAGLTGSSAAQMSQYTSALEGMSTQFGVTLSNMAQGLYYVVSAGFQGAGALQVLSAATMAAVATGTQEKAVSDLLTSSLNAYGASASQAQQYTDYLTTAVTYGKQTFSELATSFGIAAATGAGFKVSIQQMAAAEATLTDMGVPTHRAIMDLDFAVRTVMGSTDAEAAKAKSLGLSFNETAFKAMDFYHRLEYLHQIAGTNQSDFIKLVGGANGFIAAQDLLSNKGQLYNSILAKMGGSAGATAAAFQTAEQTMSAASAHLQAALSVLAYQFVILISPIVAPMLHAVGAALQGLTTNGETAKVIMLALAGAVGGILVAAIVGVVGFLASAIGVIGLVAGAIGALIGVFIYLYTTSSQVRGAVAPLIGTFQQLASAVAGFLVGAFQSLIGAVGRLVASLPQIIAFFQRSELALSGLKGVAAGVAVAIGVALVPAFYALAVAAWTAAAGVIAATWPFLLIAAAVAIVVAAFIHFYNTSATFRGIVDQIVGVLKQAWAAIVQVGAALIGNIGPALAATGGFFRQLWATLQQGWAILQQVASFISGQFAAAWHSLQGPLALVSSIFRQVASILVSQVSPAFQSIGSTVSGTLAPALRSAEQALSALGQSLRSAIVAVMPVVNAAITSFANTWRMLQPVLAAIMPYLGPILLGALKMLAIVIGGTVVAAIILFIATLVGIASALARVIAGITQFVAGVVQIFTGMAQIVVGVVTGFFNVLVDIFTGNWSKIGTDTMNALNMISAGVQNIMNGMWTAIQGIWNGSVGALIGFFSGFVTTIITIAESLYHALVGGSIFPDMVNAIVALFQNLLSIGVALFNALRAGVIAIVSALAAAAVALFVSFGARATAAVVNAANLIIGKFNDLRSQGMSIVQSMVSGIGNILGSLAGIAARAGAALISSLVGQINAGVGWVAGAINNVVATIRSHLPFSPAKVGPLMDLDKTMPAMIAMLRSGIEAGVPTISMAMRHLVQPIAAPLQASGSTFAGGRYPIGTGTGAQVIQVTVQSPDIYLDGANVTQKIGQRLATEIRRQGGVRSR